MNSAIVIPDFFVYDDSFFYFFVIFFYNQKEIPDLDSQGKCSIMTIYRKNVSLKSPVICDFVYY